MKELLNFALGKVNTTNLRFHYLRVGNGAIILEQLRSLTQQSNIEWVQFETDSLKRFHFGPSYAEFDGAVLNLDVDEENISVIRKEFWEHFIWKTNEIPQLLAIVIPNTSKYGSLTKGEIMEALSLIRLSDRPFELFEASDSDIARLIDWLTTTSSIIHRKPKEKDD